jgi:hypothetical protein
MRFAAAIAVTLAAGFIVFSAAPGAPGPKTFFQKGVNFTAEWPDRYRSETSSRMLDELPGYGINSIAIVPYGYSRPDVPAVRFGGRRIWETDEAVERIARLAKKRGLKVMLKPQIWVRRGYPGDLVYSSDAERTKWFADYRLFLEHYATLATGIGADILCVGVEFSSLSRYDKEWRTLIARTRELYNGPLVYAANWGKEFESLTFWGAVDYIGLNQYYPLPDDLSMDGVVRTVERVQRTYQRPVIFTEAGFASLEAPHREPWDETPRTLSPEEQARCYAAVLRAFYHKPWFHGVYWWKVGSNGFGGPQDGSHTPWGKPAMEVVRRWYLRGGR